MGRFKYLYKSMVMLGYWPCIMVISRFHQMMLDVEMITASTRAQKRTCGVMLYHICFHYVCKLIQIISCHTLPPKFATVGLRGTQPQYSGFRDVFFDARKTVLMVSSKNVCRRFEAKRTPWTQNLPRCGNPSWLAGKSLAEWRFLAGEIHPFRCDAVNL